MSTANKPQMEVLQDNLHDMESALHWLDRSHRICTKIGLKADYLPEEYDAFETLTSRYARAVDMLVRKLYRSLDVVEFEQPGTLLDTVNRVEKRGLIPDVNTLRDLTDLRNDIAHDYVKSELVETFGRVLDGAAQVQKLTVRTFKYVSEKFPR